MASTAISGILALGLATFVLVSVAGSASALAVIKDRCTSSLVATNCSHNCREVWNDTTKKWETVCETCSYAVAGICAVDLNAANAA